MYVLGIENLVEEKRNAVTCQWKKKSFIIPHNTNNEHVHNSVTKLFPFLAQFLQKLIFPSTLYLLLSLQNSNANS